MDSFFFKNFLHKKFIQTLIIFLLSILLSSITADEKKEIEDIVDSYFKIWSKGDIQNYSNLFHPTAIIQFKDKSGKIYTESLLPFIESQRLSQNGIPELFTEVPTNKKIEAGREVSFARVSWRLNGKGKMVTGWDYFIFVRQKDGWKIQYLLFSNDN